MTRSRWLLLVAIAPFAGVACSHRSSREASTDSASAMSAAETIAGDIDPLLQPPSRAFASDTVHAFEGTWDLSAVSQRLASAGLDVRSGGGVRQPFMGVPGTRYLLPGGELQIFLYGDAAARARDTDPVDAGAVPLPPSAGGGSMTLITSNNIAALLAADDAAVRRRVRSALQLAGRARNEP